MKFMGFCLRQNNKSGIILIVVLWVLAILSVLAIGLGRNARIDLALVKHRIGKLKTDALMWAAMNYSMNQIRMDAQNQKASVVDTVYQCGVDLQEGKTPEDIFKNVHLSDGSFDISYLINDLSSAGGVCYGFQDEERRININAIGKNNYRILAYLFLLVGVPDPQAEMLAAEIVDWHDADSEKVSASYGAETGDYLSSPKPYGCKNLPFENIEELLLVKDMTKDIFDKIKDYVTVFPQAETSLKVNINTAPEIVLKSVFYFLVEQGSGLEIRDADNAIKKIILYRSGDDGRWCTRDDNPLSGGNYGFLSPSEQLLCNSSYFTESSEYFRVDAKGADDQYKVSSQVEMIINKDLKLFSWKQK